MRDSLRIVRQVGTQRVNRIEDRVAALAVVDPGVEIDSRLRLAVRVGPGDRDPHTGRRCVANIVRVALGRDPDFEVREPLSMAALDPRHPAWSTKCPNVQPSLLRCLITAGSGATAGRITRTRAGAQNVARRTVS